MTHEPYDSQAAAYALGALDPEERQEFERHLATGCTHCQGALRDSGETLAGLAAQLPPGAPPPGVRATLLQRIDGEAALRRRAPRPARGLLTWATAAVAAMLVGGLAAGLLLGSRYEARLTQLAAELEGLRSEQARLESLLDLLRDPATRVVALVGTGPSPEAVAQVVWNEKSGGWIVVAKLRPTRPGTTYELWTFSGGRPSPAGVFDVDTSGSAIHRIAAATRVEGFAVTLEPAGGVPAPTGPIVLAAR